MRSKRSKKWHKNNDARKVRRMIEQGIDNPQHPAADPNATYIAFAHPSIEADLRALKTK